MSDAELARNYILDRLSEEERLECERRFLSEPEFESLILELERDLLDDYVNSRLSDEDAAAVRQRVARDSGQRFRLRFAESLRRASIAANRQPAQPSPSGRWRALFARRPLVVYGGLAASAALAVAITIAVISRSPNRWAPTTAQAPSTASQPHASVPTPSAPSPAPAAPQIAGSTQRPYTPAATATFVLLADQQRGAGEETSISLAPGTTTLQLQLTTQEGLDHGRYRVTVTGVQGTDVFAASHLVPRAQAGRRYIDLRVPAASLPPGDYDLTLVRETPPSQPPLTFRFKLSRAQPAARSPH